MTLEERLTQAFNDTSFVNIFGDRFDFILNRAISEKNGGFFFWKDGAKTEHKGLTDTAASAYIRFESENTSGNYSEESYGFVYNLRFVASLPNCKNASQIAAYIGSLITGGSFELGTVSLNEAAVWKEEMGDTKALRSDNVDFIALNFTAIENLGCSNVELFIENC